MITISVIMLLAAYFFMRFYPAFGGKASSGSIDRFMKSPNYKEGKFMNLEETPIMAEDASMFKTIMAFMKGPENGKPLIIETRVFDKDEFMKGGATETKHTWFGHSTVLLKINGKTIITDPVFSDHASPFSFTNKSFKYSNNYIVDDLPYIDIVLISHDHYDHLDMNTIKQMDKNVGRYLVPLGVESHLTRWGIAPEKITIADWWDEFEIKGISLAATPARHFSGRAFSRSKTLWCSWVVRTESVSLYFGADSGYGKHFKMIGEKYGPFDFCMIECGQYNKNWPNIHAMPEQSVQASIDLNARQMIAIHWAKFQLALHAWTEPIERARAAASAKGVRLSEPQIGEISTIN